MVTPASARMMLGAPATVGDLAHFWLMTHPPQKKPTQSRAVRSAMAEKFSPEAVDWWLD